MHRLARYGCCLIVEVTAETSPSHQPRQGQPLRLSQLGNFRSNQSPPTGEQLRHVAWGGRMLRKRTAPFIAGEYASEMRTEAGGDGLAGVGIEASGVGRRRGWEGALQKPGCLNPTRLPEVNISEKTGINNDLGLGSAMDERKNCFGYHIGSVHLGLQPPIVPPIGEELGDLVVKRP